MQAAQLDPNPEQNVPGEEQTLVAADCPLSLLLIGTNNTGTLGEGQGLSEKRARIGPFFILSCEGGLCLPRGGLDKFEQ